VRRVNQVFGVVVVSYWRDGAIAVEPLAGDDPVGAEAAAQPIPGGESRAVRSRVTRRPLLVGLAAAILAAGITAGALTVFSHGGASSGAGGTSTIGANLSHATAASRPTATPRSLASTGTSPPANSASCLIGTWKAAHQVMTNYVIGEPVQFSGSGETGIFRANGTAETDWGNGSVFFAKVNSAEQTETIAGTATAHWAVKNGKILFSDISSHGTITLRANGVDNVVPLGSAPGSTADRYTCFGNMLREYFPNGSAELVRQTPSSRR
jgi:hypothetical protein